MKKLYALGLTVAALLGFLLPVQAQSPVNDDVCNAIAIPVDGSIAYFDNFNTSVEAGEDTLAPPDGDGAGNQAWYEVTITNSVWFTFVAPASGAVTVDLCNAGDSTDFDTQVAVYSVGQCSDFLTFDLVAANDDIDCPAPANEYASTVAVSCITPGQTYYVLVDGWIAAGVSADTVGNFSLSITEVPIDPISIVAETLDPTCAGLTNGSALAFVTGGGEPYTFAWSTGQTTPEVTNLGVGTYTVTITDACDSVFVQTVDVNAPSGAAAMPVLDGGMDGSICLGDSFALGGAPTGTAGVPFLNDVIKSIDLGGGGALITHSPYAPTTGTQVAMGLGTQLYAGDIIAPGIMLAIDNDNDQLRAIDLTTNTAIVLGSMGVLNGGTWTGLGFDAVNNVLYASSVGGGTSILYTVNPNTGAATQLVQMDLGVPIWLAVDNNGIIYSMDIGTDALYTIDPATGASTLIGDIGFDASFAQDADFDPNTNQLYLAAYGPNSNGSMLRVADLNTGICKAIGVIQGSIEIGAFAIAEADAPQYQYLWSGAGLSDPFSPNPVSTSPISQDYVVTLTDFCGAQAVDTVSLAVNLNPSVQGIGTPDNGTLNGTATAFASGGTAPYSFSWSNGDTSETATGLATGSYTVTVSDANGCSASEEVAVGSNVSVDDLLAAGINAINIFPNPNNGVFQLEIDLQQPDALEVQLMDTRGRAVFAKKMQQTTTLSETIDIRNFSAGVYVLQVRTSTGIASNRVTIQ